MYIDEQREKLASCRKTAEVWRAWAEDFRSQRDALKETLVTYVEANEVHRAWCNGGYEGGECLCNLEERIIKESGGEVE